MRSQEAEDQIGQLVSSFLETSDEEEADRLLEQLICQHSLPIIRSIIKSAVKFYLTPFDDSPHLQDQDDLSGEVVLRLLKSLRRLKANLGAEDSGGFRLGSFRSYVAVTTYNACYDYLRSRYPERHKLKKKLRYALSHQQDLALWGNEEKYLCGLAGWAGQTESYISTRRLRDDLQSLKQQMQPGRDDDLAQTVRSIFGWLGSPVELDDLVDIVAELMEVRGQVLPAGALEEYGFDPQDQTSDSHAKFTARLEQRAYLQQLWEEITRLPLGQRTALLLSLRDEQGNELVTLLDHLRIATLSEIAEALATSAEQFARLWSGSPTDDAAIARHLGVTRQQVINLRLSARRRLARRMQVKLK